MIRQGSGHIVNSASLAGLVGFPTSMPYGATKAAVVNPSMSLRMEAAARGVKVSVTCPGPVHSDTDERRRLSASVLTKPFYDPDGEVLRS